MLDTIRPKDPVLQRYIDCFYLFKSEKNERWKHIAFPHVNTGLSFFNGVSIERFDSEVLIREQQATKCSIEILGKYTKPVFVECDGNIDEVAIIFKPLGVNRFLREDFVKAAPNYSQSYTNFRWLEAAEALFCTNDRISFLEDFLLQVFCENEEFILMDKALCMFGNTAVDYSVARVAAELNINLKTFQRNFLKMVACSLSDYKRIVRFRNSLRSKFQSEEIKSLTNITYENNYTDQSYFIREFRKLTNQTPKLFFKEVSLLGEDKIIWEIL